MNDRDEMIQRMLDEYREQLEEEEDDELLGDRLEFLREDTIERLVEKYQEELERKSGEKLFGENQGDWENLQAQLAAENIPDSAFVFSVAEADWLAATEGSLSNNVLEDEATGTRTLKPECYRFLGTVRDINQLPGVIVAQYYNPTHPCHNSVGEERERSCLVLVIRE